MSPTDRSVRLVRSVAAALVCVLTAGVAHVAAGGVLDPVSAIVVFGVGAVIVWSLSRRRLTTGQLAGLLLLCQAGTHLAAPTHDMAMGPSMIGAHLVATVVSALLLARGERFVWSLAERLVLRPLSILRALVVARSSSSVARAAVRLVGVHVASAPMRGPPVAA